jgi:hypothetical protein
MKTNKSVLATLLLTGALGLSGAPVGAQEVLLKVEAIPGYCHMKFPAIREETLNSNRPVLKDKDTSDVIYFDGSCSHDPLGKEETHAQRLQEQGRQRRDYSE